MADWERAIEPVLRESLSILEKRLPDSWLTFSAKSIVAGYENLKQREAEIPDRGAKVRLIEVLERFVQLYEARNSPVQAGKWKT